MKSRSFLLLVTVLFSVSAIAGPASLINQDHIIPTMLSFFGVGILLAFTPCILPMVPILSAILIGDDKIGTRRALQLSLVFVFSMSVTYAAAGVIAGYLGNTLQTILQTPWIIISFSLLFVLMALSMFGFFDLGMPRWIRNLIHGVSNRQKGGSFTGVAIMGILSTLIASPCITAPLISVLTFIGETGNAVLGGLVLFSLALGMGLPLIIFGMGQGALLPKAGAWMDKIRFMFGVMIMGLAIWMISRLLPGVVTMFLWASLLIISAVAFGALDMRAEKRLPPFLHGLSFLALLYGSVLLMGAASGNDDMMHPLKSNSGVNAAAVNSPRPVSSLFTLIKNQRELQNKLKLAKENHKSTMIEFYASWCPACRALDKEVFSDPSVQQRMQSMDVFRVDITEKNDALMKLVDDYHVYGTPTLIFYDKNGKPLNTDALNDGITKESMMKVFDQLID
jgi:thiol:disulfide interchange protein DsbD